MYGAQLIEATRSLHPLEFFGLGGPKMRAAGCNLVVESHDVAVVGLAEVVHHLPRIYGRYRQLLREIDRRKPKAAVLIDFPDFNFRLAKQLHQRGVPVIYFVSPQLWAWRQSRLALVKKYVTKMLVIFPFEEQWYRERGVQAEYVGHPLASLELPSRARTEEREAYAKKWGLDPNKHWIALLPGSRKGEIIRHRQALFWVADNLGREFEYVVPIAATLKEKQVSSWFENIVVDGPKNALNRFVYVDSAREALVHSRAAVVASGTATVEAALAGTPFVVVYRLSGLTWTLGRKMVKLEHFAMPNLIAGREVVPELIQDDFTPEKVVAELRKIISDGADRQWMLAGLAEVREKLRATGVQPSARAAQIVLELVHRSESG